MYLESLPCVFIWYRKNFSTRFPLTLFTEHKSCGFLVQAVPDPTSSRDSALQLRSSSPEGGRGLSNRQLSIQLVYARISFRRFLSL